MQKLAVLHHRNGTESTNIPSRTMPRIEQKQRNDAILATSTRPDDDHRSITRFATDDSSHVATTNGRESGPGQTDETIQPEQGLYDNSVGKGGVGAVAKREQDVHQRESNLISSLTAKAAEREAFSLDDLRTLFGCSEGEGGHQGDAVLR